MEVKGRVFPLKTSHWCRMSVKQSVRAWPLDLRHTQRVNKAERLFMAWYNSAILLKSSSAKSLPVWYCENRVRCHSLPVSFMAKWGCIQSCFISGWILYCIEQLSRTSKVSHKALLYGSSRQSVRCELRRNPFKHYHDDVLQYADDRWIPSQRGSVQRWMFLLST